MRLDLPTIMIVCIVIELSLTLYLTVVWANHRRNFSGTGFSILGLFFMTLNFVGLLLQERVHPLISIVLANVLIPVGYLFLITSLYGLQGKRLPVWARIVFVLIPLAVLVEQVLFGVVHPVLKFRMLTMGVVIQFYSLYIVLFLILTGQFKNPPGKLLVVSFIIQFIIFGMRIPYSLSSGLPQYFIHTGGFQSLSALSWIIVSCAWPTGFALLISQQLQDREKLQNEEKTILLKELHHRTKNNMQSIIAYIQLQQHYTDSEEARSQLQAVENRIQAINLVHRKLLGSASLSRINLKAYVEELTLLVFDSYRINPEHVRLVSDIEDFEVLIDMAIPIGLIINELFSNAFKYAFPDGQGLLSLMIRRGPDDTIEMTVRDNGKGLPPGFDPDSTASLGLQTVSAIVKGQLRGTLDIRDEGGFSCRMTLDNSLYRERV